MLLGRWIIIVGVVLVVLGVLWPWISRLGLGRLPGDYIPIVSSLL